MIPPVLRPSSLPGLAKCPRFSPDQEVGEQQKSDGTKRHTALAQWLAVDPNWRGSLGEWDAGGVEWAGEYIRATAPTDTYELSIEDPRIALLSTLDELRGTPDVVCGPILYDLKGRAVDSYREQMAGYVLLCSWVSMEIHVLYATERRAVKFRMSREEAETIVEDIAARVADPAACPRVSDFCGWCANRKHGCPAFAAAAESSSRQLGITIPSGDVTSVQDADGLAALKQAAEFLSEWAKAANTHVREMAIKAGVVATGYKLARRKGPPSVTDAWAAFQASGLTYEQAAPAFSVKLGDLVEVYSKARECSEKLAKQELEVKLGPLIKRGEDVQYLTPV